MNEERREKGDVDELREVLDVVSERVPALLRAIRDVLYSKEAAESMAEAVAIFYEKLVEAGVPPKDALEMAKSYMIDVRNLFGRKGLSLGDLGKEGPKE
ncbi:MAG: hypothetical protein ACP5LK_04410 [Candidatus Bipolaricaulaceae bacterium]